MFSSWPDLSDWALLDRRVEVYSKLWARVKSSQARGLFSTGKRNKHLVFRKQGSFPKGSMYLYSIYLGLKGVPI